VIFSAIDFWTVKNITGRLLVGLRWWSEPLENGEDKWHFECKLNDKDNNDLNYKVFWYG
jgi:hypothetical protein